MVQIHGLRSIVLRVFSGESSFSMTKKHPDLIVIAPNRSLSKRGCRVFFSIISSVSLLIAVGFSLVGAWPILPFAGIELLVLYVALKMSHRSCSTKEVIEIDDHYVRVEVGCESPCQVCAFKRPWTRVWVIPSQVKNHPDRLFLRYAGKQVEVGKCLSNEERRALAKRLEQLIQYGASQVKGVAALDK